MTGTQNERSGDSWPIGFGIETPLKTLNEAQKISIVLTNFARE